MDRITTEQRKVISAQITTFTGVINAQGPRGLAEILCRITVPPHISSSLSFTVKFILEDFSFSSFASIFLKCMHSGSSHQNCRY